MDNHKGGRQRKQKYRRYTKKVIAKIKQEVRVKETGTNMRERQKVNPDLIQFSLIYIEPNYNNSASRHFIL